MTTLSNAFPQDHGAGDDGDDGGAFDPASSPGANATDASGLALQSSILLLEDNLNQADPLCELLRFAGYACVPARDIATARAELAKPDRRFAVMVADLNLTRSDHVAFVREARSLPHHATLPVIIATGHDSREAREQAQRLGRTDYLVKPFASVILLQLIARWTGAKP